MKWLLPLLYTTSLFCDTSEQPTDVLEETSLQETNQEVASLDLNAIAQLPSPHFEPPRKSVTLATSLSYLLPGLGHTYLGDMQTAGALMGTAGLGVSMIALRPNQENIVFPSMIALQNTWSYGIFAAYRDARIYNGQAGYTYKMPTDSLAALAYAPFNYKILRKPEVWGGLIGSLGLAMTISYFAFPQESKAQIHMKISTRSEMPFFALPVGISEEALFRGYLQSQLLEKLNPFGGILISSLAFGASHISNATLMQKEDRWRYYSFSIPLITALGAYLGWLTHKNHSLQESVAVHTLYDLVLFTGSALATKAAIGHSEFALAIPF